MPLTLIGILLSTFNSRNAIWPTRASQEETKHCAPIGISRCAPPLHTRCPSRLRAFLYKSGSVEGEVVVSFEGREVTYDVVELDEVALAYAPTVHKSQGSAAPTKFEAQ